MHEHWALLVCKHILHLAAAFAASSRKELSPWELTSADMDSSRFKRPIDDVDSCNQVAWQPRCSGLCQHGPSCRSSETVLALLRCCSPSEAIDAYHIWCTSCHLLHGMHHTHSADTLATPMCAPPDMFAQLCCRSCCSLARYAKMEYPVLASSGCYLCGCSRIHETSCLRGLSQHATLMQHWWDAPQQGTLGT